MKQLETKGVLSFSKKESEIYMDLIVYLIENDISFTVDYDHKNGVTTDYIYRN